MEVMELKRELAKAQMRAEAAEALCKELEEENAALRDAVAELEALTEEPEPEKAAAGWDLSDPLAKAEERVMVAMIEPRLRPYQEDAVKEMIAFEQRAMEMAFARAYGDAQDGHLSVRLRESKLDTRYFVVDARYGGVDAHVKIHGEDLLRHEDRERTAEVVARALAHHLNARGITPTLHSRIRKLFEQKAVEAGVHTPPPDYYEVRRRPSDKYVVPKPERTKTKTKRDDPTPRSPKQRGGR